MKKLSILVSLIALVAVLHSCKKKTPEGQIDDNALYQLTQNSGFTYYQNDPKRLHAASVSPHSNFVRVSFNSWAQSALDANGVLPTGSSFPDSSIVLKEVFDDSVSSVSMYAVMMKMSNHANAGDGWLWAEYNPGGGVVVSLTKEGGDCVSCHSDGANRDLVRTFEFH